MNSPVVTYLPQVTGGFLWSCWSWLYWSQPARLWPTQNTTNSPSITSERPLFFRKRFIPWNLGTPGGRSRRAELLPERPAAGPLRRALFEKLAGAIQLTASLALHRSQVLRERHVSRPLGGVGGVGRDANAFQQVVGDHQQVVARASATEIQ